MRITVRDTVAATLVLLLGACQGEPALQAARQPVRVLDPARSTLMAASGSAVANGTAAVTLTATARDASGAPISGRVVEFTVVGSSTLSSTTARTRAGGKAVVTLTSTMAGAKDVSVSIDGVTLSEHATATFVAGPAASLAFAVQPTSAVAGEVISPAVQVTVEDDFGNAVSEPTEITIGLTGGPGGTELLGTRTVVASGGTAAFADLSIRTAGTGYALSASGAGATGATSDAVSIAPAAPDAAVSDVSADPISVEAGGTSALTATVRDAFGNPVPGVIVAFGATGSDNTVSAPAATGASGVAGGTLLSTKAEPKTVTATAGAVALSDHPVVTFAPGAPGFLGSSLAASPTSVPADGAQSALTVVLGDSYGNPVPGRTVIFSSSGTANLVQPAAVTAADGTATGAVSALVTGDQTISAHVGAMLVAQTDVTFTSSPSVTASSVAAAPSSVPADGTTAATVTVTVKDRVERPVAGAAVALEYSGPATLDSSRATTNEVGVATFTLTSSTVGTGVLTATVDPDGAPVVLARSATLRFTPTTFSMGGFVFGLTTDGLVLATAGQPDLAVAAGATRFWFPTKVPAGTAYDVSVKMQPPGHTCSIRDGSGIVGSHDAIGVVVDCGQTWKQVAAGISYTVAVKADGSLYAWGNNLSGELGDGTREQRNFPVLIGTGFSSVAAGANHTVAVKSDGSLWAWGYNGYGQLGDGSGVTRYAPVRVGEGFASAAAGFSYTVAIKTDGSLYAWGRNDHGQLGDGSLLQRNSPVLIGSGFASASAGRGGQHTVAIKTDGALYAWGGNGHGQVGDGSTTDRNLPVLIGAGFASAAAGDSHTIAIETNGSLYAWGANAWGQLGDGTRGTRTDRLTPVLVGSGFASASACAVHTLAVKIDGSLYAWGFNSAGALGDSTPAIRIAPVFVGSGYASVSTGASHTLAIKLDGSLHAWGLNDRGARGDGSESSWGTPTLVGSDVVFVAAGDRQAFAVKTDSSLYAWGDNVYGALGDGTTTERHSPVLIGSGFASVDGGVDETVALQTDGSLYAWGLNGSGQLGDGSLLRRNTPVLVGPGFASASAGGYHTVAITTDGSLYAWGSNSNGQLGDGSLLQRKTPVFIGSGFASVSGGAYHTVAVTTDGSLYAWGSNRHGQLGDGSLLQRNTPVFVGSGFTSVAAGDDHTVALKTDGSLYAWGWNSNYQLGDGSSADGAVPVLIGTGFASIAAGRFHSVAVKTDGSLYAWGCAFWGLPTHACSPVPVLVGSGFASAAAGALFTVAVRLDGSLWAWGSDDHGQLGDGFGDAMSPQPVPSLPMVFGVAYAASPVTYPPGTAITPNVPTSKGGPIASYEVSPALPEGLFLDAATGILSGIPSSPSPMTSYAVTATGPTGATTTLLTIAVVGWP